MLLFACAALFAARAGAEEQLTFKERYERAVATFKSGQYDKAIAEFQAAYEMKPLPLLLFNLAQAHRKAGHHKEALDLYQRFLEEEKKPDLRPETEKYIQEMKDAIDAERKAAEQAERERAEQERLALQRALAAEPSPDGWDRQTGKWLRPPPRIFRWLKFGAAGAGLAAVVTGAALMGVDGQPFGCDLSGGQRLCPQQLNTLVGGGVTLGVGVALLGASAAFFVLDYRQAKEQGAERPWAMLTTQGLQGAF